jgi:predicted metal-binding transcription factor (methanogenesis marker protein 9)
MLRLNKKDVRKAYNQLGYGVCFGDYYEDCGIKCACPIGALALANHKVSTKLNYSKRSDAAYKWAVKEFGEDNVNAFMNGFDSVRTAAHNENYYDYNGIQLKYYQMGESLGEELLESKFVANLS